MKTIEFGNIEIEDIHTTAGLEDYMIELVEANMEKSRSRTSEFKWLKKTYKAFAKRNFYFSEKEFARAYYTACAYLYED